MALDVRSVHHAVSTLETKLNRIEGKQDDTNLGVVKLLCTALTLENQASLGRIQANPSTSSRPALESPQRTMSLPPVYIEEKQSSPPVSPRAKRPLESSVSDSGLKVLQGNLGTPRGQNEVQLAAEDTSRVFGRTLSSISDVFSRTRPPNGQ